MFLLCALGAIVPLAAAFAGDDAAPPALVVSGVFGLLTFGLLWSVLAPLRAAARLLNGAGSPGIGAIWPSLILKQVQAITQEVDDLRRGALAHPLTQLPTRAVFIQRVAATLGPEPSRGVVGVVRMMDYDALAAFDQQAADAALVSFASRLRKAAARHRLIAQIDRDRFVIWFPDASDASELQALAYVLSQEIAEGQVQLAPQIEVGAAVCPRDGADAELLLSHALGATAAAGRSAPGSLAPSAMSTQARERFALSQEVRRALKRDQLSLRYQPVIDLRESRVVGAEALLRWTHPELGAVSPSDFVPLLEQSGQMQEVGLWVLNAACREARAWRDRGLGALKMSVNLSPVQCRDPSLPALVKRTLERHGLEPAALELELTETAAMEDPDATRLLLAELRGLGVDVAIDDFGAGYSSLTYLKNLPFSKLKIDREFVTRLDERRDSQAICSALVALAKGLGIRILAEGVERREELETLRSLGCSLIQGYYFAKPLESDAFARTIVDPEWLALAASPVHRQRALIDRRARL